MRPPRTPLTPPVMPPVRPPTTPVTPPTTLPTGLGDLGEADGPAGFGVELELEPDGLAGFGVSPCPMLGHISPASDPIGVVLRP